MYKGESESKNLQARKWKLQRRSIQLGLKRTLNLHTVFIILLFGFRIQVSQTANPNSSRSVETCSSSLRWCSYGDYGELGLWAPSHAERGPSLAQAPRFVQPQQLGRQLLARDLRQRTRHVHIISHPLFFFGFCWMLVYRVHVFVDLRRILLIFRVYFGVFSS